MERFKLALGLCVNANASLQKEGLCVFAHSSFFFFILSMTVTNFLLSAYGKAPGIRRHVAFCVPLPIICKERMIRHGKSGGKKMDPGRSRRCIGNFHRSSILVCPAETQAGSGGISGTDCHVDSIGCKKSLIKISGTFLLCPVYLPL